MKKIILLLLICLTGCSKKLICTKENENINYKEIQNIAITFDDDKAKVLEFGLSYETDNEEIMSTLDENMNSSVESLDDSMKYNIDKTDNKLSLNLSMEIDENTKITDSDDTYEDIKNYFEDQGYSCK